MTVINRQGRSYVAGSSAPGTLLFISSPLQPIQYALDCIVNVDSLCIVVITLITLKKL